MPRNKASGDLKHMTVLESTRDQTNAFCTRHAIDRWVFVNYAVKQAAKALKDDPAALQRLKKASGSSSTGKAKPTAKRKSPVADFG